MVTYDTMSLPIYPTENTIFLSATVMITGMARNVIVKEMAIESNTSNISPYFDFLIFILIHLRATNLAGWGKFDAEAKRYYP